MIHDFEEHEELLDKASEAEAKTLEHQIDYEESGREAAEEEAAEEIEREIAETEAAYEAEVTEGDDPYDDEDPDYDDFDDEDDFEDYDDYDEDEDFDYDSDEGSWDDPILDDEDDEEFDNFDIEISQLESERDSLAVIADQLRPQIDRLTNDRNLLKAQIVDGERVVDSPYVQTKIDAVTAELRPIKSQYAEANARIARIGEAIDRLKS
jgi:hypothetical protein